MEHDEIILKFLRNTPTYKKLDLKKQSIINKDVFNIKQFEYICLTFYETFMKNFYKDDDFQVRLLDHQSINGCAFKIGNTNYSIIHWGTISTIYEKALKLTENKDFFPKCFSHKNWRPINEFDILAEDKNLESKYRKLYPCGTNDQTRRDLAILISTFSWLSTVFHEAGHILHGHLGCLKEKLNEDLLTFFYECSHNDEKSILRKTLEKDADEFAGNRIIENAFQSSYYSDFYPSLATNKKALLEILITGITLKFLLYGINSDYSPIYLPTAYRISSILDSGLTNLEYNHYFEIETDKYNCIIVESINDTISSYNKCFPEKLIDRVVFKKHLEKGIDDDKILKKKWNDIRPILDKHKNYRFELPPLFEV